MLSISSFSLREFQTLASTFSSIISELNSRLSPSDHIEANYSALAWVCNTDFLSQLVSVMEREYKNIYIPNTILPHILCLCVLVSKTYSFNAMRSPQYSDIMICSCWQRIDKILSYLNFTYGMNQYFCNQLLAGRNHTEYHSTAEAKGSEAMVSMTKTSKFLLDLRHELLSKAYGLPILTDIDYTRPLVVYYPPQVHRLLYMHHNAC